MDESADKFKGRLKTFLHCKQKSVVAFSWAKAGFHYNKEKGIMICDICKTQISAVKHRRLHDPLAIHLTLSKGSCPYLHSNTLDESLGKYEHIISIL